MRKLFILFSAASMFLCGCCNITIPNGDLVLKIDGKMQFKVESTAEGAQAYYADYSPADILVADEAVIDNWKVSGVEILNEENGETYVIRGSWKENGYDVEKILTVTVPADFQNMVLVSSSYVNHSDKMLTSPGSNSCPLETKNPGIIHGL